MPELGENNMTDVTSPSEFLDYVYQLKTQGKTDPDIANELGVSISKFRANVAIAKVELRKKAAGTNPNKYIDKARELVLNHYNRLYLDGDDELHISEVYVVWFSKTLQNWKALVATEIANDGLYFEVTHNGDKNETYLDAYKKMSNEVITETVSHSRVGRDA